MEYDFNEYSYEMVSVHVYGLNTNLCNEVTGGFFVYLLYVWTDEMYKSVLQRGRG